MTRAKRTTTQRAWCQATALAAALFCLAALERSAHGDGAKDVPPPLTEAQQAEFFETKVRPVLADNCYGCHGSAAQMGSLRLDSRAAILRGGASGPSVSLADPEKSLLVQVVHQTGEIKMPPGGKLKTEEMAALTAWVRMGMPWPGAPVADAAREAAVTGEYRVTDKQRAFWSFQPVRRPTTPSVKNAAWARSPIDRFVLYRLEAKGLKPAPAADRRTLIRRVTLDLHGVPPTPAEVDAFVQDRSPDAFARVVDRLLSSPRYGERWARHWLDVARYADTKGYVFNEDREYPHAYNYRDWVVRAFNEDLPYDKFVVQQLAADRLPLGDDRRPLAALGYLTVGRRFLNSEPDIIDDRIDVTMRGLQGLTVSCARCHDHKFDPIPTKDYYSLYGVFASSMEPEPQPISPKEIAEPYAAHHRKVTESEAESTALIKTQVALLRERQKKGETLPDEVTKALQRVKEKDVPEGNTLARLEAAFEPAAKERLQSLRASLDSLKKTYPAKPELVMTLADKPQPVQPRVFRRGNRNNPGDVVPRRFLQILSPAERPEWKEGSGRLEMAQAIASKSNPLTARVLVNRVWQQHFGSGIVRTASDFGLQGERPTHPELLDYLAWQFMEDGWSIKKLHRRILLSATYQQSSAHDAKAFATDPENRLLWRMNRRRLDLEAMRDSMLSVAGALDGARGGPAVDLWKAPYPARRTVYGRIDRQNLPGIFRAFDFANPDTTSPQRFRTTVPQQALFLMNHPFVVEQARRLAARPEVASRQDDPGRIKMMIYLLYGRPASADEVTLGLGYLKSAGTPAPATPPQPTWRYGYGRYDEAAKKVVGFTPLPHWTGQAWQGGPAIPDPKLSFLLLNAEGGHVGQDADHAVIRRWVAPQDGIVRIAGTLRHPNAEGDGVRARIVSSRAGLLGEWTAKNGQAMTPVNETAVQRGDTIDFVVDARENQNYDSFTWSPTLSVVGGNGSWNAATQFGGPAEKQKPLMPLERFAQALLLTNEFQFVD